MRQERLFWRYFVILLGTLTSACSSGSGRAKLQFKNTDSLYGGAMKSQGYSSAASSFEMKLIAAYLAEDVNPTTQNNVGKTSMFWLNAECAEDIMHCNTDASANGGKAEDGAPWSHIVSTFFNFTNPITVNAQLNNQGREIDTGDYKYVRLEFCKWNGSQPNVKWAAPPDSAGEFAVSNCGITQEINPPITVNAGDSVTITLSYTLANSVEDETVGGGNCNAEKCFTLPTMIPSASK